MNYRLNCRNLSHSYGDCPILQDVNFSIETGKTLAIMGRSGCGKSTLLRCLCLLEAPSSGEAELEGQVYMKGGCPLFAPWQIRSQIAMVFQDFRLFPNLTALRNLTLALEKTIGIPANEAKDKARFLANRLGIEEILDRYPETLSGGQAQRLALARAMLLRPRVLLLDEVTAALDPESIFSMTEAVRQVRDIDDRGGLSIILVTHILRFAIGFADNIAFLHDGKFVDLWPSKEFASKCEHPVASAFVKQASQFS